MMKPTPDGLTKATTQDFAQMLRALADLYEADSRMLVPDKFEIFLGGYVSKEQLAALAKALATGGTVDKILPKGEDGFWFELHRVFGGLPVSFTFPRDLVCKRVQKMQMVETWDCSDSLLDFDKPKGAA
jgi:hypothetical protein